MYIVQRKKKSNRKSARSQILYVFYSSLNCTKLYKSYEHFVFFVTAQCGFLIGVTTGTSKSCAFS